MRALVVLILAALLAGCSSGTSAPTSSQPPESATPLVSASGDLLAQRKAAGIPDCPPSSDLPSVSGGLPDIALECLGGGSTVRMAGLRGPLLINVWAQWCAPCRLEAPHLREFSQMNQGKVAILGIDAQDPRPDLAIEFAGLVRWNYPHVTDVEKKSVTPLGVSGIPVSLFVDQNGVVVYKHIGAFGSTQQIRDLVQQHLGVVA